MLPKRKIREHTEFLKTFQTGTPRREWIEDLWGGGNIRNIRLSIRNGWD